MLFALENMSIVTFQLLANCAEKSLEPRHGYSLIIPMYRPSALMSEIVMVAEQRRVEMRLPQLVCERCLLSQPQKLYTTGC